MQCPKCGWNTPDAWEKLIVREQMPPGSKPVRTLKSPHDHPRPQNIQFDWMHCAADGCKQLVVRGHHTYSYFDDTSYEHQRTDTWLVFPRHSSRPLDPLVSEKEPELAKDYAEAGAILDASHRMSSVLARSIVADLLEALRRPR